jgi:hypothetical protein
MCTVEFRQVDTRHITTQFLEERFKSSTVEKLWVEQCVAKKEMGL